LEGGDTAVNREQTHLIEDQRPTGIRGLDSLLQGGLVSGGVYLVLGRPGSGKTTLGNHIAYNHIQRGGNALYVTVLAETHDRMLRHLSGFDFLDIHQVGKRIHYLSVYDEMLENGLDGVKTTLRRVIREREAGLVVIDGTNVLEMAAGSPFEYSRFVADLSAQMSLLGCIGLLLAVETEDFERNSIAPYVDGIFVLEDRSVGLQDVRYLHMAKVRGVGHVRGRHRFTISNRGIEVYPRIESVLNHTEADLRPDEPRLSFGIPGLDDVLRGGVLPRSMTMVWGAPGVGKTMLGVQFVLEGASRGERGLIATFHETPLALAAMARGLGHDLEPYLESGVIRLFRHVSPETPVDDWAWDFLDEVEDHQPKRVLVDGISDVARLGLEEHRTTAFYQALTGYLSSRGITAVFTAEAPEMYVSNVTVPRADLATSSDIVLLLRYVEVVSRMHRILSVLKVRGAGHDHAAREFRISEQGVTVLPDGESAMRILAAARAQWASADHEVNGDGEIEKKH
jgi:circadian clock protein KaiC